MSLILDALKKSEKSRNDDASSVLPLIVKPRRAQGKKHKKSPFLPVTIILLALAALFLVYVLSSDRSPVTQQTVAEAPREKRVLVEEVKQEPLPTEAVPVETTVAETAPVTPATVEKTPEPVEPAVPVERPATVEARQQVLQETGILSTRDTTSIPPRLSKIPGGLRKEVQPLRLDFHVYSTDRQRRIVFINGQQYREGRRIRNNLELVRIVPEGAVMDWKGQQFLLTVMD